MALGRTAAPGALLALVAGTAAAQKLDKDDRQWLDEVRQSALSSVLGLFARDTQIEFGHVHDDVVVLGASALLMERQLGLGLAR